MLKLINIQPGFLLPLLCFIAITVQAQTPTVAGRVVFATGNPVATNTSGTQRSLNRGDDIFAGDNLRTPVNSRLQISFVDGAYISLQPESEYEIEEYKYAGRPDGTESAAYKLIKGGIRAVTGLIGKDNPEAYKVNTAVATIGIRGTGHNTRICQGDCGGKKDGLYHSTWEGITYVKNDVAQVNVPAGKGVFVRDMNAPIQFLSQPSSVTAVETAGEREEEQREGEDQTRVVAAGDQRNIDGEQRIIAEDGGIIPTSSTVLLNNGLVGVLPDDDLASGETVNIVTASEVSVFIDDNGQFIGILMLEDDEDGSERRVIASVDLAAVLGGDHRASVDEISQLLTAADPVLIEAFKQNPAGVAESHLTPGGIGWGRWSDGNFLVVDDANVTELIELVNNQSLHFIFGPEPPDFTTTTATGTYQQIGGTQSTSASGDSIGLGAVNGQIFVDFSISQATIDLDVNHAGNLYYISGPLSVDKSENNLFNTNSVMAEIISGPGVPGGNCNTNPGCTTFIDGGFAGELDPSGRPLHIGIEYDIQETDAIMGVAGFTIPPPN